MFKIKDLTDYQIQGNIEFESVDQIVHSQLSTIDSQQYDPNLLLELYRNL